jgi:hypothetical protein
MVEIPFPLGCPLCGAIFDGIMWRGTSSFQWRNYQQHRDLLFGRNIAFYNHKQYNTSFRYYGDAMLPDLVRFTLSVGHRETVLSTHGGHLNPIIVSYPLYRTGLVGVGGWNYTQFDNLLVAPDNK